MAKAAFHKNQRVFVKPVGTWAIVEQVLPQWIKGLEEPLKIHYDVGLGREFAGSELAPETDNTNIEFSNEFENWRVGREKNRWNEGDEKRNHPHPGTFPVVMTDEKNWGGWRVPIAEYDRDPQKIEFQAKVIESAPAMMEVSRQLAKIAAQRSEDLPSDLLVLAKHATTILRKVYTTSNDAPQAQAAE